MREELAEHEGVVRLRMILWEANVFIHVEGYNMLEPVC